MEQRHGDPRVTALIDSLTALHARAIALEQSNQDVVAEVTPAYQNSARNLLHYLALRQVDLRDDQEDLADLGLSSLGRSEAHTLHTLEAVLRALHKLAGKPIHFQAQAPVNYADGNGLLEVHTQQLFGTAAGKRDVRIMVTMPSEAATDAALVRHLVASGMDVMRINCAHDTPDAWAGMIDNLNRARRELGRECKIYADLAGPKLRTGVIAPGPQVLKLRPTRNSRGQVTAAARAIFTTAQQQANPAGDADDDIAVVPITAEVAARAHRGDVITLTDARGKERKLEVVATRDDILVVESDKTVYVETGGRLTLRRKETVVAEGAIGDLPAATAPIVLNVDDRLVLTNDAVPGQAAVQDAKGHIVTPAHISCQMEGAFRQVKPGESIWLDDGKIGGRVLGNDGQRMTVQITHAAEGGSKLQAEKGINFPDSTLDLPALTPKDLDDLAFMAERVDIIGMSFVREPDDVLALAAHLDALDASHVGTVLKIENRRAFENLPHLLLACMRRPPVGVMVARGDLAVEVGYERLAEVQEQILWLCEAAHIPVIWATQVLESLAKRGAPSRAEVSDAVMSGRAECVMLNKGPYIVEAVRFLNGVLERMSAHQSKKRARFRPLSVSKAVTT
jgi:pyruvate kinase